MNIGRVFILMFLCLAAAVVAGCGDSRYDSRLLAADSLINARPDSALALLSGIAPGEITAEADRAYYSLLVTQAKYKCDRAIKSTDTIDVAIAHFADNHDREKYTRSLIYKGAVLDELGDKTEAMLWYKRAEENADTADFFNLGYVNMRMAGLYDEAVAENELDISKYKEANRYFIASGNKKYQLECLKSLGKLYRARNMDSAYHYLFDAIKLSRELRDKKCEIQNYILLSRAYYIDSLYDKMKETALYVVQNGSQYLTSNDCIYNLCRAYALLNMPDSAQYYFERRKFKDVSPNSTVSRLITQYEIEKSKGNYQLALRYNAQAEALTKAIESKSPRGEIYNTERTVDKQCAESGTAHMKSLMLMLILILTVVAMLLLALWWRHRRQMRHFMDMISQMNVEHINDIEAHLKQENTVVDEAVVLYFEKARQFVELFDTFSTRPEHLYRNFKKFVEEIRNVKFYRSLRKTVDDKYDGLTVRLEEKYPNLTAQELDIICMVICRFPNSLISFYMGYKNEKYIYKKKKAIEAKLNISSIESLVEIQ